MLGLAVRRNQQLLQQKCRSDSFSPRRKPTGHRKLVKTRIRHHRWVLTWTFYTNRFHSMSSHVCHVRSLQLEYCRFLLEPPVSLPLPSDWHVLTSVFQSTDNVTHIFEAMWRFKNRFSQVNTGTKGKMSEHGSNLALRAAYLSWSVAWKTSNRIKQCLQCAHVGPIDAKVWNVNCLVTKHLNLFSLTGRAWFDARDKYCQVLRFIVSSAK